MPAPVFRAAGTQVASSNNVANPTNLSPVKNASTVNGDLMLCITGSRSNSATVGTPTGWTLLTGFPVASGTASGGKIYVFSRIADGGANDAPTVTWTGVATTTTGDSSTARIISWQYGTTTQAGTVTSSDLAAQTTSWTAPAITTTGTDTLAVSISVKISDTAQTATMTTFTERFDGHTTTGTGHLTVVGEKIQASAGSTGTATVTPSSTTSSRVLAVALAMQAQAAVPADVVLASSPATADATLDLSIPAPVPLGTAAATSDATLDLTAPTGGGGAAIGTPVAIGTMASSDSASPYSLTTTGAVPSGSRIFVRVSWIQLGATPGVITVSGGGLSWAQDHVEMTNQGGNSNNFAVWSADCPSGLASSTALTIALTPGSGGTRWGLGAAAFHCSGIAASSRTDGATSTLVFAVTPWDATSLTTTNADDLLIISALGDGTSSPSNTLDSPWVELADWYDAGNTWTHILGYRIVSSTGTYAGGGDWGNTPTFGGVSNIAAYKGAVVAAGEEVPLDPADGVSAATLTLTAPARVPLATSPALSNATLALTAKPTLALETAAATSSATLAVRAATGIVLGTSPAITSATLSVSAGFNPDSLTGLTVWLDASALTPGSLGSAWNDLSGAGNHGAVVGSPAPTVQSAALNGLNTVRMTANEGRVRGNNGLTGSTVPAGGPGTHNFTVVYVTRMVGPGVGRIFTALYPGANYLVGFHTSAYETMYDNGWVNVGTSYPSLPSPWRMYGSDAIHDGVDYLTRFLKDGVESGTATTGAGMSTGYNLSGYAATTAEETCDCEVAELVIYDRKLSDVERGQVEDYLRDKWLPSAGTQTSIARVALSSVETPIAGTQTLRVRARASAGAGVLRVWLYDSDGTTIRGGPTDFTLTGSFQTFTLNPTGITDYSELEVAFQGLNPAGALTAEVSWVELALPESAGAVPAIIPLSPAAAIADAGLVLKATTTVPLGSASAVSSATLTVTAPGRVILGSAAAISTATLALTARTTITLSSAPATSSATLALTAVPRVALQTAAAQSSATLALTAPARVVLQTSPAQSSATLNLAQYVPLQASPAQSSATLALTAQARVTLQSSPATSSATLALTAQTTVVLQSSAAVSSATLALSTLLVPTIPMQTAAATTTATLALTAQTRVTLQSSPATSTATLALSTPTLVTLQSSPALSTATLTLTARATAVLETSAATSSATLTLTAPTRVVLQSAAALSAASLTVYAPTGADVQTGPAHAISNATLAISAQTRVPLQASAAVASATLALGAATRVTLQASAANSAATLALSAPARLTLVAAGQSAATLALTAQGRVLLQAANAVSTTSINLQSTGIAYLTLSTAAAQSAATLAMKLLVSKLGGVVGTATASGTRTALVTKSAGATATASPGGTKKAALARAGGAASITSAGAAKKVVVSKAGGVLATATSSGQGYILLGRTGGALAAAASGGGRKALVVRAGGGTAGATGGGVSDVFRPVVVVERAGGASATASAGAIRSTLGDLGGGGVAIGVPGATNTVLVTKAGGATATAASGGEERPVQARMGGVVATAQAGGVGDRLAAPSGAHATSSAGGARTVESRRTGGGVSPAVGGGVLTVDEDSTPTVVPPLLSYSLNGTGEANLIDRSAHGYVLDASPQGTLQARQAVARIRRPG